MLVVLEAPTVSDEAASAFMVELGNEIFYGLLPVARQNKLLVASEVLYRPKQLLISSSGYSKVYDTTPILGSGTISFLVIADAPTVLP